MKCGLNKTIGVKKTPENISFWIFCFAVILPPRNFLYFLRPHECDLRHFLSLFTDVIVVGSNKNRYVIAYMRLLQLNNTVHEKKEDSHFIIIKRISGGSSVTQNKLPQLVLGYIYTLKYLQSNFIG